MKTEKVVQVLSPSGQTYDVGQKDLVEDPIYSLFKCGLSDTQAGLLKIATAVEHNGVLDREAYLLQTMNEEAKLREDEYAKIKDNEKEMLNYQFFFPRLIESFVSKDNGDRRINILSFSDITTELVELASLLLIRLNDRVRVDPKTSAWMMGKLLKLLDFTHSQGISGQALDSDNILINREKHFIAVFDWSGATMSPAKVTDDVASGEIAAAAQSVILALGGDEDDKTFSIPEDEQLTDTRYADFLKNLASGGESDAGKAHTEFYELVRSLWPKRGFHPYTTYKI